MKGNELLLEAIGGVDPALVEDAREADRPGRRTGRRALTLALAAALVLALSATAYGYFGGADWFKGWFADRSGGLTASQEAYIDANAVDIGQSVTVDGWTVTVRSALADQYDFCILLRIDPPAGAKLDADGGVIDMRDLSIGRTDGADKGAASGHTGGIIWSEEGDGSLTCVWTQGVTARPSSDFSYLDGAERTVRLEKLRVCPDAVVEGPWEFTLTLPASGGEAAELAPEPVPCQGEKLVLTGEGYERLSVDMTLTSFRLTALGAVAKLEYGPDTRERGAMLTLPVTIVLAGGAEIKTTDLGGAYGDSQAEFRYQFPSPVVLSEVDHVRLPGGVALPMPEVKENRKLNEKP